MLGVNRSTGEKVAIKIIDRRKFLARGEESLKMFMREISILRGLNHPNICKLKATYEDSDSISTPYLLLLLPFHLTT